MTYFDSIILGLLQGVAEFFPISSSGHLVIAENFFKLDAENLIFFNVLVHLATLLAILFYFRQSLLDLFKGLLNKEKSATKMVLALIIGTLPAVIIGLPFKDKIIGSFSTITPVVIAMAFTGVFFMVAEKMAKKFPQKSDKVTVKKGLIIGIFQAIALIPGVSRSGSTLAIGLITGLDRIKSAEFSFLLAIPAIGGAGLLTALDLNQTSEAIAWGPYFAGFLSSLIAGYFAISLLMKLYRKHSLNGFAIYLFAVAGTILLIQN